MVVVSILLALVENLEKTNLVQDVVNMNQGSVFKILMFRRFCAASSPSSDQCTSRSEGCVVITWHNHHLTDAAPQGGCPWRQSAPVPFLQRPLCGVNTGPASIPRRRRQHFEATARPEKLAVQIQVRNSFDGATRGVALTFQSSPMSHDMSSLQGDMYPFR